MTDEELTARLRDWPYQGETMANAAADRIEDLTKERDTAREYAGEVRIREKVAEDARIKAEAKLAKAAEMLEAALKYNSAMHGGAGAYNKRIKDTLAEIKGESHD